MAISSDPFAHFVDRSNAIRFSKAIPCQAQWKVKKTREEAATRDEVQWRMQFEQHQLARPERLKIGCRRWTPEIDFFHLRAGCVEIKPLLIRYIRIAGVDQEFTAARLLAKKQQRFRVDRSVIFLMSAPNSVTGELAARFVN